MKSLECKICCAQSAFISFFTLHSSFFIFHSSFFIFYNALKFSKSSAFIALI